MPSVGLVKQGGFHKIACYWLLVVRTMEREKGSTSRWREWGCVTKLDMRSGHRRHASTLLRERGPSGRWSSTSLVQWCNSAVVLWCCGALVFWMGWCSIRKRSTQPQTSPFNWWTTSNWWIDEAADERRERRERSWRAASLCPQVEAPMLDISSVSETSSWPADGPRFNPSNSSGFTCLTDCSADALSEIALRFAPWCNKALL